MRHDIVTELERLVRELEAMIEQKSIDNYFDKQNREYLVKQMRMSPMFADLVSHITEEIISGVKIVPNSQIPEPYNMEDMFLPEKKSEFMISIDSNEFLKTIAHTYKSDTSIVDQFLRDFHRQIIKINGIEYKSIDELFFELSSTNRKTKIANGSGKKLTSMMALLLITCQSTNFVSYIYPHEAVSQARASAIMTSDAIKNDHKISTIIHNGSEARKVDAFADPVVNYYVINGEGFNITDIVIDSINLKPSLGCVIDSVYKVIDTSSNDKIYDVKTQAIYTENADRCLIKYTVSRCQSSSE